MEEVPAGGDGGPAVGTVSGRARGLRRVDPCGPGIWPKLKEGPPPLLRLAECHAVPLGQVNVQRLKHFSTEDLKLSEIAE